MRKGLTKTLMAVAVAIMAVQAMALAPVILDIPSPVVGQTDEVSGAIGWLYPDAIDLARYVSDDQTPVEELQFSYEIGASPLYTINGVAQLVTGEDPLDPPSAKKINSTDGDGNDGDPLTITIDNTDPNPALLTEEAMAQLVTLYVSDGENVSANNDQENAPNFDWWFYTDIGGVNRLSPGHETFTADLGDNALWANNGTGTDGVDATFDATNGFCLTTTADDSASKVGGWGSPFIGVNGAAEDTIALVQECAWQIKATIVSNQASADQVPFFDMTVNNIGPVSVPADPLIYGGGNYYGANFFFLSNVGGANAAVSATGTDFEVWWCPSPVSTDQWNDTSDTNGDGDLAPGPWAPLSANYNDAFVEFRILQDPANPAANYIGARSNGTLCLQSMVIVRYELAGMNVLEGMYDSETVTQDNFRVSGSNMDYNWDDDALAIGPNTAGSGTGTFIGFAEPGDFTLNYVDEGSMADNYPVEMADQTLYLVRFFLSAPSSADALRPPSMFWVGADTLTDELIQLSWVSLNGYGHGMPKVGDPQEYKAFFFSNYGTANSGESSLDWWNRFRPRFMVANNPSVGGTTELKTGKIRIHEVAVDRVFF